MGMVFYFTSHLENFFGLLFKTFKNYCNFQALNNFPTIPQCMYVCIASVKIRKITKLCWKLTSLG